MATAAASSQHGEICRIIRRFHVSPANPPAITEASLLLTYFDVLWLAGGTVERLFFYDLPGAATAEQFAETLLPNLKSSLSLALQRFFPISGRLRRSSGDRFEISYKPGDSVVLILAEAVSGGDFRELSGSQPRDYAKLHALVPALGPVSGDVGDGGGPLFTVQVTVFPNQGVCIGTAILHVVCDGTSSMSFMRSWAAAAAMPAAASVDDRLSAMESPLFDRSVIADPDDQYSQLLASVEALKSVFETLKPTDIAGKKDTPAAAAAPLFFSSFTMSKEDIGKLKKQIQESRSAATAEATAPPFRCSAFVAASAYVWCCVAKARRWPDDRAANFSFAADCRARLSPPVPESYFGNCVTTCDTEVKVGEMAAGGSAEAIGGAVGRMAVAVPVEGGGRIFAAAVKKVLELLREGGTSVSVAGSPRLKVYDVDFGWGRPAKVEVVSIKDTGAFWMSENRDEPAGGIDVGLALPETEIHVFRAHFLAGLERVGPPCS